MDRKTERINLRVTENIKNKLEVQAENDNRSVSNYIENLILNDLNKIDLDDKRWIDLSLNEKIELLSEIEFIEICSSDNKNIILNFINGFKIKAIITDDAGFGSIKISDLEKFYR